MKALVLIALGLALEGGFLLTLAAGSSQAPAAQAAGSPMVVASAPGSFAGPVTGAR